MTGSMKLKTFLLVLVLSGLPSGAVIAANYNVNALKKLFTDKQERARIDAIRRGGAAANEKKSNKIKVNGYMTRSDGKSVVWVNNQNTLESHKIDDIRVQSSNVGKNKQVTIRVDGKTQRLKPGETWNKNTNAVSD